LATKIARSENSHTVARADEARKANTPSHTLVKFCFSVDHPPPTLGNRHTFRFRIANAHVESMAVPEAAVAYEEKFLLEMARKAGFRTAEMLIGGAEDWQRMLLCRK
jgi:hypothetical protein